MEREEAGEAEEGEDGERTERRTTMSIAIFHSAYDPANSRPQRLQRDLCELPDVRLLATLYSLCALFYRETERTNVAGKRGNEKGRRPRADARRTTGEDEDDDDDEGKLRAYRSARCSNSSEACRLASTT